MIANLRELVDDERAGSGTADAAATATAQHRAQWSNFAAKNRDARVQRLLLAHVDRIVEASPRAGDPRMAELAAIAAAERRFWAEVAPLAPAPAPARTAAPESFPAPMQPRAADAVRTLLAATTNDGDAGVWLRTAAFRRWVAGRLAWERVRALCDGIAADAARKAPRTRDGGMAATYRELDASCRDLRDAIALLLAPPW